MDEIQLDRIQHQIETELNIYDNEINKLASLTYPTQTCLDILEKLREKINHYRFLVKNVLNDSVPDNPKEIGSPLSFIIRCLNSDAYL